MQGYELRVVGEAGSEFLIAKAADLDSDNRNGDAWVYDRNSEKLTGPEPLQLWFKFGTWPDPKLPEDGQEALLREVARVMRKGGL